ncbi:MAG: helix-turn-helix transcriptional regulator [Clostridia bacterium]|nr:helix-turn-helix transcriptional regulator [Clostridia bacterium]
MKISLGEKLKTLRKEKNISQEKLASFLEVSYQAISKWENDVTCPDIFLLPEIARFFNITVDELLQVEKIDEAKLYAEYEARSAEFYENGHKEEALAVWQEAYKRMPNNVEVKEMLMSMYYDVDKVKYREDAIALAIDIWNSTDHGYYRGQAISLLVSAYLDSGNRELAKDLIQKAAPIFCSRSILWTRIDEGEELIYEDGFCVHWFLEEMYYLACSLIEKSGKDTRYAQSLFKAISEIYETLYLNDDMSYETMKKLAYMHINIALDEIQTDKNDFAICQHIKRSVDLAEKSVQIKEHYLTAPMVAGWKVTASPSDKLQIARMIRRKMESTDFDALRTKDWFVQEEARLFQLF